MNAERKNTILGILRNQYAMFGDDVKPMLVTNYLSFNWGELTDLAGESEHLQYTPPPTVNMWVSGKHEILPSIMDLPSNIGKPVAETALESLADKEALKTGYTVIEAWEPNDTLNRKYWIVLAPDGQAVNTSTFKSMAEANAEHLNDATLVIRQQNEALLAENAALHMENQAAKITIADLEKRIADLEAQRVNNAAYMTALELKLYPDMAKDENESHEAEQATLTEAEINWLAAREIKAGHNRGKFLESFDGAIRSYPSIDFTRALENTLCSTVGDSIYDRIYMLKEGFDTPANRAAIEAHRAQLESESK